MMEFKDWFVAERARALATVLLTRRSELVVRDTKEENGLDFTVHIRTQDEPGKRPFGVLLRATMTPVTTDAANKLLKPSMASIQAIGPFNFPVCVFYFTVKDDQGYYTWAVEPIITNDCQPKLKSHHKPSFSKLDNEALEEIVSAVNRWYDTFYAMISV